MDYLPSEAACCFKDLHNPEWVTFYRLLPIPRLHCAFCRLRRSLECTEHKKKYSASSSPSLPRSAKDGVVGILCHECPHHSPAIPALVSLLQQVRIPQGKETMTLSQHVNINDIVYLYIVLMPKNQFSRGIIS